MNIRSNSYDSKVHMLETLWLLFFIMCILGWLYETVLEVAVYHWGFSNRGLLFGPWLPIYGIGGLLYVGCCYPIVKSGRNVFIRVIGVFYITMLIATTVELAATYILEAVRGGDGHGLYELWDQFPGKDRASTSIRFGLWGFLGCSSYIPLLKTVRKGKGNPATRHLCDHVADVYCRCYPAID